VAELVRKRISVCCYVHGKVTAKANIIWEGKDTSGDDPKIVLLIGRKSGYRSTTYCRYFASLNFAALESLVNHLSRPDNRSLLDVFKSGTMVRSTSCHGSGGVGSDCESG
jgi:hypothetical protein